MDDPFVESNSDAGNDRVVSNVGMNASTPRWVKVFGSLLILLILLFVIMLFARGPHGPGRHLRPGGGSGQAPTPKSGA